MKSLVHGVRIAAATVIALPPLIVTFAIRRRQVSGFSFGVVKG